MEENSDEVNNERIFLRELNRLKISLEAAKAPVKIIMLHYPPFNRDGSPNEFFSLMRDYHADICIYGHLHGEEGHKT